MTTEDAKNSILDSVEHLARQLFDVAGLGENNSGTKKDLMNRIERAVVPHETALARKPEVREGERPSDDPIHTVVGVGRALLKEDP